jgi:transposase
MLKKPGRVSKKPENKELLKMYETMTASEIAEKYGVATSTVRGWINKTRKETGKK